MKKFYTSLMLAAVLLTAPKLWAQAVELPPEACVTQEVSGCQDPNATLFKWSEGTSAWPDEACNPFGSFGDCNTNSCDHANAWAQYVCENNGYDIGIWTGRKQAGCGPGGPGGPVENGTGNISVFCGGSIPCDPIIENTCQPTDQTQIEVFCCDIVVIRQIPTLSEFGLIAMAAVLGIAGFMVLRRRNAAA